MVPLQAPVSGFVNIKRRLHHAPEYRFRRHSGRPPLAVHHPAQSEHACQVVVLAIAVCNA